MPTLFGVSLLVFLLTNVMPEPKVDGGQSPDVELWVKRSQEQRKRFRDLPLFINTSPRDVSDYSTDLFFKVANQSEDASFAERELVRLGGAAFPYILPELGHLPLEKQKHVTKVLMKIASRIFPSQVSLPSSEDEQPSFWLHFWDDHALDYTDSYIEKMLSRYLEHGKKREAPLLLVDTLALPALVRQVLHADRQDHQIRLVQMIAKITSHPEWILNEGASPEETSAILARIKAWWFIYSRDYVNSEGLNQMVRGVIDTRYARWMLGVVTGALGVSDRDGLSIAAKFRARANMTFGLTLMALFLSYFLAIPVSIVAAFVRKKTFDSAFTFFLFFFHASPPFVFGLIFFRPDFNETAKVVTAALILGFSNLAIQSRYDRNALLSAMFSDYVRTAKAKGAGMKRIFLVHLLPNTMVSGLAFAVLGMPQLIGGSLVMEIIYKLPGLGPETLSAITLSDGPWLIMMVLASATLTVLMVLVTDLVYGMLDPRMREVFEKKGGGRDFF